MARFSKRHDIGNREAEIRVSNEAPEEMRSVILDIAYELGLTPKPMRTLLCRVLRKRANPDNWSEWPNIESECQELIQGCEWYEVYDVIESLYELFLKPSFQNAAEGPASERFSEEVNNYFLREGIGWQLHDGEIVTRGSEAFESALRGARDALDIARRHTARDEIHEALSDLSRRPEPDLTGAVQHAMAALECVARDVCGDDRATLGEILKRYPHTIPKPLDESVTKAWGYASEMARHLREGRKPERREVELVVGLAAVVATYLSP